MSSALERLAGPGKSLAAEPPDAEEIARLKHSGVTRLKDAQNKSNSRRVMQDRKIYLIGGEDDLRQPPSHRQAQSSRRR